MNSRALFKNLGDKNCHVSCIACGCSCRISQLHAQTQPVARSNASPSANPASPIAQGVWYQRDTNALSERDYTAVATRLRPSDHYSP